MLVVSVMAMAMAIFAVAVPTAQASTPWGACGNSTAEAKEVTRYYASPRFYYYLRCGNASYGYRHILARHRADFEQLAAGTYQNWRDVADLAMDSISRDPDVAKPAGDGKGCLSRVIFLRNLRTNQVVRQQNIGCSSPCPPTTSSPSTLTTGLVRSPRALTRGSR